MGRTDTAEYGAWEDGYEQGTARIMRIINHMYELHKKDDVSLDELERYIEYKKAGKSITLRIFDE